MEFFGDLRVDLVHGLLFGDVEDAAAGFTAHAFEDLSAVDEGRVVCACGVVVAAALAAAVGIATTAAAGVTAAATARIATAATTGVSTAAVMTAVVAVVAVVVMLFALVVDGVDDGIGALGGFDGAGDGFFAVAVYAIGEEDEGAAAFVLGGNLVGGEEDGVIKGGAAVSVAAVAGVVAGVRGGLEGGCGG